MSGGPWNRGIGGAGSLVLACALSAVIQGCASAPSPSVDPPASAVAGAPAARRTVLDGVFTAAQAARGRQVFQQSCASCHSPAEFSGPVFQRVWTNRSVGELYGVISTMMPQNDPGSLSPAAYADVITFFLMQNGYPDSENELVADPAVLERVIFRTSP